MQDAVRGEFHEVSKLLIDNGALIWSDGQVHMHNCVLVLKLVPMPCKHETV